MPAWTGEAEDQVLRRARGPCRLLDSGHGAAVAVVAAELGDGWIPAFVTRDRLPAWAAELSQLRKTAAPHAEALSVVSGPITAAGENPDAARDLVGSCVAWYLSAMGDVYRRSVSGQGYAAEVRAILAANPQPSPRHGVVPPEAEVVLDQLAAYGTSDQVGRQLGQWDQAADIVTILLPSGLPWSSIEATLLAAAPGAAAPGAAAPGAASAADRPAS